jgi:hypothetical protein
MRHLVTAWAILAGAAAAWAQDQQTGARTKAMGGSYTAFEDDPISVWLNPAGIATQPDAMALAYQSYTVFEPSLDANGNFTVPAEMGWSDPALVPSYLGLVFQLGKGGADHAVGLCFAAPFRTKYMFFNTQNFPEFTASTIDQSFYRLRLAYAHDFRLQPKGGTGFLTHVSVGVGADLGVTSWKYEEYVNFDPVSGGAGFEDASISVTFNDMGFGGGAGILVGLYDDGQSFKANLGAAYQSRAGFDFSIDPKVVGVSDWPNQVNAGMTFYLLEGQRLRLTLDAQWINWDRATADSGFANKDDFADVFNYSAGLEYVVDLGGGTRLYPRAGVRLYDAPWDDEKNLPAIGFQYLAIQPSDEKYIIYSAGFGLGWATAAGRFRTVDLAVEYGGEEPGVALGMTLEF